jgi:hypothetical protein
MDTRENLISARVGMLALADELQNISRACQVARISRSHFSRSRPRAGIRTGRAGSGGAPAPPDAERDFDGAGATDPPDDTGFPDLLLCPHYRPAPTDRRLSQPGSSPRCLLCVL